MLTKFLATSLSMLVLGATASAASPSGPWAKYNGKFKADALFRDASGGYLDKVKSIVKGGHDVNWQREGDGRTPLMSAAAEGHADIVAFMLSQGADPTLRDQNGKTALDFARAAGAMDVVRMLQNAMSGTSQAPASAGPVVQASAPQVPASAVPAGAAVRYVQSALAQHRRNRRPITRKSTKSRRINSPTVPSGLTGAPSRGSSALRSGRIFSSATGRPAR